MPDMEPMVLPLIAGVITLAVVAAVALRFGLPASRNSGNGAAIYLPSFLLYLITYPIGIFFQAAVAAARRDGHTRRR